MFQKYYVLYVLPFFCGFSLLAYEMLCVRLLMPYFGSNNVVWTHIFGVFILALALGYLCGGALLRVWRSPLFMLLLPCAAAALIFCSVKIAPFCIHFFSRVLLLFDGMSHYLFWGSIMSAMVLFLFPVMLLSMLSPYVIGFMTPSLDDVASYSGRIYGLSTLGSLFGILLTELCLLPLFGLNFVLYILMAILFLLSVLGGLLFAISAYQRWVLAS
eukprot:COSAG01_NODE_3_length_63519_cov_1591.007663_33_plen_215_part_00